MGVYNRDGLTQNYAKCLVFVSRLVPTSTRDDVLRWHRTTALVSFLFLFVWLVGWLIQPIYFHPENGKYCLPKRWTTPIIRRGLYPIAYVLL
jgi:hypothetical protein